MPKLTKDLTGVRAGQIYPETIVAGQDCPPELLDAARALDSLEAAESKPARASKKK